jgi:hypothetical protein
LTAGCLQQEGGVLPLWLRHGGHHDRQEVGDDKQELGNHQQEVGDNKQEDKDY